MNKWNYFVPYKIRPGLIYYFLLLLFAPNEALVLIFGGCPFIYAQQSAFFSIKTIYNYSYTHLKNAYLCADFNSLNEISFIYLFNFITMISFIRILILKDLKFQTLL